MLRVLFIAILLFPFVSAAQDGGDLFAEENDGPLPEERKFDFTVDDLHFDCKKCIQNPVSRECTHCDGVLTGVVTTMGVYDYGKRFCPPNNMDTNMVRNAFRRWFLKIDDDPKMVHMRAVPGLIVAMQNMFPCKVGN